VRQRIVPQSLPEPGHGRSKPFLIGAESLLNLLLRLLGLDESLAILRPRQCRLRRCRRVPGARRRWAGRVIRSLASRRRLQCPSRTSSPPPRRGGDPRRAPVAASRPSDRPVRAGPCPVFRARTGGR
jgi:hypothetical protein